MAEEFEDEFTSFPKHYSDFVDKHEEETGGHSEGEAAAGAPMALIGDDQIIGQPSFEDVDDDTALMKPEKPYDPPQLFSVYGSGQDVAAALQDEEMADSKNMLDPFGLASLRERRSQRCRRRWCLALIGAMILTAVAIYGYYYYEENEQLLLPDVYTYQNSSGNEEGPEEVVEAVGNDTETAEGGTPEDTFLVWRRNGHTDLLGANVGDRFGETVVLNEFGDVLAVGAPVANTVQVYYYGNHTWNPMGSPILGVGQFGVSVSLNADGTILAVGGNLAVGNETVKGHVRVFVFNMYDWVPMGAPIEGDHEEENLGWSVAISGEGKFLAVGSPSYGETGRVQLFFFHQGAWELLGGDVMTTEQGAGTGFAVALSSDASRLAVVTATSDREAPQDATPSVTVWHRHNHTHWQAVGNPITDIGDEFDHLGQRIALSRDGNSLAVSARYTDGHSDGAIGFTQLYRYEQQDWVKHGQAMDANKDENADGVVEDHTAVALSADGTYVVVGSPHDNEDTGRVRVFTVDATDGWTQVGTDVTGPRGFGASVSISSEGDTLAVGAGRYRSATGMARVYTRHDPPPTRP